MNEQIKAELDVFAKDASLAEAKRINGLRAVFGEVSCFSLLSLSSQLGWCMSSECCILQLIFCFCYRFILIQLELWQSEGKLRTFWLIQRTMNGYPFLQNYVEVVKSCKL